MPFGLRIACRRASWPTSRSPCSVKATTDGVVRAPSALGMTVGSPPFHGGDHRVGRAEIDADCFCHGSLPPVVAGERVAVHRRRQPAGGRANVVIGSRTTKSGHRRRASACARAGRNSGLRFGLTARQRNHARGAAARADRRRFRTGPRGSDGGFPGTPPLAHQRTLRPAAAREEGSPSTATLRCRAVRAARHEGTRHGARTGFARGLGRVCRTSRSAIHDAWRRSSRAAAAAVGRLSRPCQVESQLPLGKRRVRSLSTVPSGAPRRSNGSIRESGSDGQVDFKMAGGGGHSR